MSIRAYLGTLAAVTMTTAVITASCGGERAKSSEPPTAKRPASSIVSASSSAGDPTPLQVEYEGLHNEVDPVVDKVRTELSRLPQGITAAGLTGVVDPFIMRLVHFDSRVLTLAWPVENRPDAKTVAAAGTTMANDLLALGRTNAANDKALVGKVLADDPEFDAALTRLTQELHLPPGE